MALTSKWGIYSDDPDALALGNTQDAKQAQSIEGALDRVVAETSWQKEALGVEDLNELITPGAYPALSLNVANIPTRAFGTVSVYKSGNALIQTYVTVHAVPQVYVRRGDVNKSWLPWYRQDPAVSRSVALTAEAANSPLSSEPIHYEVRSSVVANALGMPTSSTGLLIQRDVGTITVQEWIAAEGDQSFWIRSSRTDINSARWTRIGPGNAATGATGGSSGTKIVPLAVSLPAAPATVEQTSGAARWVRSYAHAPSRIRIHISNRNPGSQDFGGKVQLTGLKVGKGKTDGTITDAIDGLGITAIPADGSEVVTPWLKSPVVDGEPVGITVGWEGAGTLQRLDSGGWTKASSTGWADETADGWTQTAFMPFYVWIEAEFPARIPVVAGLGDSITVGRAATNPIEDSWLSVYCRSMKALPLFLAQSGSSMIHWVPGDKRWTSYYPGVDLKADALVNFLGQNNLLPGESFESMKTRFRNTRDAIELVFPKIPIYLGGITPSASKTSEVSNVRQLYNIWLKTLPGGARGYFDFPTAIGGPNDIAIIPNLAGDALHPNTAGHAAMANVVLGNPITPATLTESETKALTDNTVTAEAIAKAQGFTLIASEEEPEPTLHGVPVIWIDTSVKRDPKAWVPKAPTFDISKYTYTIPGDEGVDYLVQVS